MLYGDINPEHWGIYMGNNKQRNKLYVQRYIRASENGTCIIPSCEKLVGIDYRESDVSRIWPGNHVCEKCKEPYRKTNGDFYKWVINEISTYALGTLGNQYEQ